MKIGRILGVILSTFIVILMIGFYKDNNRVNEQPFELNDVNGVIADNSITYENTRFDEKVNSNEEVIEYVNRQGYAVTIDSDSINTFCTGGSKEDEALATKNYKVRVSFSDSKYGRQNNNMTLKPGEKGYIKVTSSYEGAFPTSEVKCNYNIGILAA